MSDLLILVRHENLGVAMGEIAEAAERITSSKMALAYCIGEALAATATVIGRCFCRSSVPHQYNRPFRMIAAINPYFS
jgi:hypothetical protein